MSGDVEVGDVVCDHLEVIGYCTRVVRRRKRPLDSLEDLDFPNVVIFHANTFRICLGTFCVCVHIVSVTPNCIGEPRDALAKAISPCLATSMYLSLCNMVSPLGLHVCMYVYMCCVHLYVCICMCMCVCVCVCVCMYVCSMLRVG